MWGEAGDDSFWSKDDEADGVSGGTGWDRAQVDKGFFSWKDSVSTVEQAT